MASAAEADEGGNFVWPCREGWLPGMSPAESRKPEGPVMEIMFWDLVGVKRRRGEV